LSRLPAANRGQRPQATDEKAAAEKKIKYKSWQTLPQK